MKTWAGMSADERRAWLMGRCADSLPSDSEPHGEDATVAARRLASDNRRPAAEYTETGQRALDELAVSHLRTADGAPWSPGEGHIDDWPHRMARQVAAHDAKAAESPTSALDAVGLSPPTRDEVRRVLAYLWGSV